MSLKIASRLTCIAALSRDTSRIVRRAMVWVLTAREVVRYSTNSDRQSSSSKSIGLYAFCNMFRRSGGRLAPSIHAWDNFTPQKYARRHNY